MQNNGADKPRDENVLIVLHVRVILINIILIFLYYSPYIISVVVDRDSCKANLHYENKEAVHVVSVQFAFTNELAIIFFHVCAFNFESVIDENVRQEGHCVKIITKEISAVVFVKGIINMRLMIFSFLLYVISLKKVLDKIILSHQQLKILTLSLIISPLEAHSFLLVFLRWILYTSLRFSILFVCMTDFSSHYSFSQRFFSFIILKINLIILVENILFKLLIVQSFRRT